MLVIDDIQKYEKLNNVAINIYHVENKKIEPLRPSPVAHSGVVEVDMLLIHDDGKSHYLLIKNLSALLRADAKLTHHRKAYYCKFCLHHSFKEDTIKSHIECCKQLNKDHCLSVLPKKM
eukprot:Lithocolla_globosa_v1_NODE_1901_length_2266_cov_255.919493.p4 type:complete len:119 gc:universal NODE_1901_length_2266_cov_255.919493:1923-1567(-)